LRCGRSFYLHFLWRLWDGRAQRLRDQVRRNNCRVFEVAWEGGDGKLDSYRRGQGLLFFLVVQHGALLGAAGSEVYDRGFVLFGLLDVEAGGSNVEAIFEGVDVRAAAGVIGTPRPGCNELVIRFVTEYLSILEEGGA